MRASSTTPAYLVPLSLQADPSQARNIGTLQQFYIYFMNPNRNRIVLSYRSNKQQDKRSMYSNI